MNILTPCGPFSLFPSCAETPQGREQLRQAVHEREDRPDADGQAVHDEPGPDRVHGLLVPQPGVRATRVIRHARRPTIFLQDAADAAVAAAIVIVTIVATARAP